MRAADAFALGAKRSEAPVFLIARCEDLDEPLAGALTERGARVLRLPLLTTEPGADLERLDAWLAAPPEEAGVAWTSRRAAEALVAAALPRHEARLRALPLFALGAESAAPALKAGCTVILPAEARDARRLAEHISGARSHAPDGDVPPGPSPRGSAARGVKRVAVLQGDRALPDLSEGLRAAGLEVDAFEVYRTVFADADVGEVTRALARGGLYAAAFLSPSGVEALERRLSAEDASRLHRDVVAIAKGGTTHRALVERGYLRAVDPGANGLTFEACALDVMDSLMRTRQV
jgi:uroporphyrinogen-III synthase